MTRRQAIATASAAIIAGAAPRSAWGRTEADVIIIGAGLAGLHAATMLEAQGVHVVVLEGDTRVGGRMHTLDDLPGAPEAGGVQIGSGYARVIDLVQRHHIPLGPAPALERNALYHVRGRSVVMSDWASSEANHLEGTERTVPPAALSAYFAARLSALDRPVAWTAPQAAPFDIPYAEALRAAGASSEALRLIAANLNGNALASLSALHVARTAAIFRASPGPIRMILGGSQRLPEAMATGLAAPPRTGHTAAAIREADGGVTIQLVGGGSIQARHALCTIPFAALRGIPIDAVIGANMAMAIAQLPYTRASFAYLAASDPFWLSDGLPATLWSDDPLIGRVFALSEDPPMLKVWLSGPGADRLDGMQPAAAAAAIIARIDAARPSARGKLSLARLYSWQKNPMARGIYHHIGAGQGAMLAASLGPSHGRLHFAGEHLAATSAGMEGALESGAAAAEAILRRS